MELLSNKDFELLSTDEKKLYYEEIKNYCLGIKNAQLTIGQSLIKNIYPLLRNYNLEFQGEENIPSDTNVLFLVNHSNSHDIFTGYEMFSYLGRQGSVMVATDCLNPVTTEIFNISNATLLDRRKELDRKSAVFDLASKILQGKNGLIFGESTWNIHPILPMHNIRLGISQVAAITGVPIIPTIFEYIEKEELVERESQLFKKCVIRFGKPVVINFNDTLVTQTNLLKNSMSEIRKQVWKDYSIEKESIEEIDPLVYLNHTYAKKFKALGFNYDSKKEQEFLLFLNGEPRENEYYISESGEFVPGITEKGRELKRVK